MDNVTRDSLTGAYARAALPPRFAEEAERCDREGGAFALAIVDIDHFKSINDAFGHQRGDLALVDCVRRLEGLLRTSDEIFRYGGDEFVILMPNATGEQALAVAVRLVESVRATPFPGEPPIAATVSVGVAAYPADGATLDQLFARADDRLYTVKRAGRNAAVADDAAALPAPLQTRCSRLIEREGALASFHAFLDALSGHCGTFAVVGPRGAGRSRFLEEAAAAARLRGARVLALQASTALKARSFGALVEALGAEAVTEEEWLRTLQELAAGGAVLVVDNLPELDPATLAVLGRLFAGSPAGTLALVYSAEPEQADLALPLKASLRQTAHLAPLTTGGLQVWLRGVLQDEPAPAFVAWLYRQTRGLPGLVEATLAELKEQGVLHAEHGAWGVSPTYVDVQVGPGAEVAPSTGSDVLPASLSSFVGRERELREVKRLLEGHRLITLLGPGGVGKTRLALQAASEVAAGYRHGVQWVQLAAVLSAEGLPGALVEALQLVTTDRSGPRERLLQYLQHKQMLLVLDNFEHLVDGADLVMQLLQGAPHLTILVTSRERLHLPEEALLEVSGLPVPTGPADWRTPAVQLFVDRALPLTGGADWPPGEMAGVVRICQLVHGMPLAIELAAAWVRLLSCTEIAEGVAASLDFLAPSHAQLPARHRSLRAVFEHSWSRLSPEEQQAYARLSVFRGGFDLKAASQVAGASLFMLSALLDKSLVRRTATGRFEVHELLRQFAAEALGAEAAEIDRRHAAYFLALAGETAEGLKGPRQVELCDRLSLEHPNLRAALQWAIGAGEAETALRFSATLHRFWGMRGHESEGRRWVAAALALPGAQAPGALRARALDAAEHMARRQGDIGQAKVHAEAALAIWRELGDEVGAAITLIGLGMIMLFMGDPATAEGHLQESRRTLEAAGNTVRLMNALNTLGQLYQVQGKLQEATGYWESALVLARELQHPEGTAMLLSNLSIPLTNLGEYARARACLEESVQLSRDLGNKMLRLNTIGNLGMLGLVQGDLETAGRYLHECLHLCRQVETKLFMTVTFGNLGIMARRQGELGLATARHAESLTLARQGNDIRGIAYYLLGMAAVKAAACEPETAARVLGAADAYLAAARIVPDLVYQQEAEYAAATAGAQLGEAAFAGARSAGRALPLEEALALVAAP